MFHLQMAMSLAYQNGLKKQQQQQQQLQQQRLLLSRLPYYTYKEDAPFVDHALSKCKQLSLQPKSNVNLN
jgi:hypothetical protein